jgi:ATP-dependent DNA helicase RecG
MNLTQDRSSDNALPEQSKSPSIRDCLRALGTPIRFLKGVGPKRAAQLEVFGLSTIEDLLYHLPFRYEDRREIKKLREATVGKEQSFVGQLTAVQAKYIPRRRRQIMTARLYDETGSLGLVWYRAPSYMAKALSDGQTLLIHGKVEQGLGVQKRIIHPEFEVLEPGDDVQFERIRPIYLRPGGLPLSLIRKWVAQALEGYLRYVPRGLPEATVQRHGLLSNQHALAQLHDPTFDADVACLNQFASAAHRSIIFDELFHLQLGLGLRKKRRTGLAGMSFPRMEEGLTARMRALLPFKLTGAQKRVLVEIDADMGTARPMQRLLQGDVGSGKTMVAWLASLRVIQHGYQALWMAPTELLAEQHFRNLKRYCELLEIKAALLTASLRAKEKRLLLEQIKKGEAQFIVGTHALIQESVCAPRMGLGVIDEQHRFGVMQRMSLQGLVQRDGAIDFDGQQPHMLLMSATPIPRSLAMVLYGDMEVSFLDEMPPGRTPVRTKVFGGKDQAAMYRLVLDEIRIGHQAFIVYPLVEASEQLQQIRDATRMAEELSKGIFRDVKVGLAHGRMRAEERDRVMRQFRDGDINILVATTVIEVGIDIPNATVMIVEHAERFGLSQLHQLRGRVGRGQGRGYCLLVNHLPGGDAVKRLRVMEQEHDGFKIAQADLSLRGPGEFLGTRQSGLADFRLANLARDSRLLMEARREALEWLERDPELKSGESVVLRAVLRHRWGQKLQLGAVG